MVADGPRRFATLGAMADRDATGIWRTRLRWRLRGAWQWPTFAVATVAGALLLSRLPFAGTGMGVVPAFLLAGFINLAVVAVVAPAAGVLLRRRRPEMPREVAADAAGATALVAVLGLLVAGGLAHRSAVRDADADFATAVATAQRFLAHQGPPQYRGGWGHANTWQPGPHLYRTCFPGRDERHSFCVLVDTANDVPTARADPDQRPNATIAGPDNPGRAAP
jgi:hypothetical protein